MARANLNTLLSVATAPAEVKSAEPEAQPAAEVETPVQEDVPKPAAKKSAPRPPRQRATATTHAHWTELERLEARLRDDQVEDLDALARRLNKQRNSEGERITKNTLLRVAADLLLAQQSDAAGSTEAEIRASLTKK